MWVQIANVANTPTARQQVSTVGKPQRGGEGKVLRGTRVIMDKCKRVKDSGAKLAPACNVKLSKLGCKVWENMLLQGITLAHSMIAASAPHMMYKKRSVLDYTKHSMLKALEGQHCSATQLESARLFAIHTIAMSLQ